MSLPFHSALGLWQPFPYHSASGKGPSRVAGVLTELTRQRLEFCLFKKLGCSLQDLEKSEPHKVGIREFTLAILARVWVGIYVV